MTNHSEHELIFRACSVLMSDIFKSILIIFIHSLIFISILICAKFLFRPKTIWHKIVIFYHHKSLMKYKWKDGNSLIKIAHIYLLKDESKRWKWLSFLMLEIFWVGWNVRTWIIGKHSYWNPCIVLYIQCAVKIPSTIQTRSRRSDLFGRQLIFGGRLLKLLRTFVQFTRLTHTAYTLNPFWRELHAWTNMETQRAATENLKMI